MRRARLLALQKIGGSAATKKQKMDAVYVNLDSRLDRKESIEHELAQAGAMARTRSNPHAPSSPRREEPSSSRA